MNMYSIFQSLKEFGEHYDVPNTFRNLQANKRNGQNPFDSVYSWLFGHLTEAAYVEMKPQSTKRENRKFLKLISLGMNGPRIVDIAVPRLAGLAFTPCSILHTGKSQLHQDYIQ